MKHIVEFANAGRYDDADGIFTLVRIRLGALCFSLRMSDEAIADLFRCLLGREGGESWQRLQGDFMMHIPKGMKELTAETLNVRKVNG